METDDLISVVIPWHIRKSVKKMKQSPYSISCCDAASPIKCFSVVGFSKSSRSVTHHKAHADKYFKKFLSTNVSFTNDCAHDYSLMMSASINYILKISIVKHSKHRFNHYCDIIFMLIFPLILVNIFRNYQLILIRHKQIEKF